MKKITRRGMLFGFSLPFFSSVAKAEKQEEELQPTYMAEQIHLPMFTVHMDASMGDLYVPTPYLYQDNYTPQDKYISVGSKQKDRLFLFPRRDPKQFYHNGPENLDRLMDRLNHQLTSEDDFFFNYSPVYNGICPMRLMKRI